MNHFHSGQRHDMDQGPFSLLTGGLGLTLMGSLQPVEFHKVSLMTDHLEFKNTGHHLTCFTKAGRAWHATLS